VTAAKSSPPLRRLDKKKKKEFRACAKEGRGERSGQRERRGCLRALVLPDGTGRRCALPEPWGGGFKKKVKKGKEVPKLGTEEVSLLPRRWNRREKERFLETREENGKKGKGV